MSVQWVKKHPQCKNLRKDFDDCKDEWNIRIPTTKEIDAFKNEARKLGVPNSAFSIILPPNYKRKSTIKMSVRSKAGGPRAEAAKKSFAVAVTMMLLVGGGYFSWTSVINPFLLSINVLPELCCADSSITCQLQRIANDKGAAEWGLFGGETCNQKSARWYATMSSVAVFLLSRGITPSYIAENFYAAADHVQLLLFGESSKKSSKGTRKGSSKGSSKSSSKGSSKSSSKGSPKGKKGPVGKRSTKAKTMKVTAELQKRKSKVSPQEKKAVNTLLQDLTSLGKVLEQSQGQVQEFKMKKIEQSATESASLLKDAAKETARRAKKYGTVAVEYGKSAVASYQKSRKKTKKISAPSSSEEDEEDEQRTAMFRNMYTDRQDAEEDESKAAESPRAAESPVGNQRPQGQGQQTKKQTKKQRKRRKKRKGGTRKRW